MPMALDASSSSPVSASRPLLFALNGSKVELPSVDPSITLLTFLRSHTRFTGTKLSCGEGGCGACLVLLAKYDVASRKVEQFTINSCLTLLCSIDGCSVTTIEGLGSSQKGFHAVQERIAGFHGSQCGFCTPGMCMAMYACLRSSVTKSADCPTDYEAASGQFTLPNLSVAEAQKAIVGNICRCTGYRPILDACASFAGDVDVEDLGINTFWASKKDADIRLLPALQAEERDLVFPTFLVKELKARENLAGCNAENGDGKVLPSCPALKISYVDGLIDKEERVWIEAVTLEDVFEALHLYKPDTYDVKLVVGNTSAGYYKDQKTNVFIDISHISELLRLEETEKGTLDVGSAVTIDKLIKALESESLNHSIVPKGLASHLKKVANPHVRNRASVGGNLIMAQQFTFDSDLATLFLSVGVTLKLAGANGKYQVLSMEEFLHKGSLGQSMVLESISIPLWLDVKPMSAYRNETMENGSGRVGKKFENGSWIVEKENDNGLGCAGKRFESGCASGIKETDNGLGSIDHENGIVGKKLLFKSFRAAPRQLGNSLAYINAAFLAQVSVSSEKDVACRECYQVLDVRLAFGAFGQSHAIRAKTVESFLVGKTVSPGNILGAIEASKAELSDHLKDMRRGSYKLSVAVGFLFDFFRPLLPEVLPINPSTKGTSNLISNSNHTDARPINKPFDSTSLEENRHISGKQSVTLFAGDHFLGKPLQKFEAKIQAAGEAVYVDDIPSPDHCLHAAFVLSDKALAKIKLVDPKPALSSPGVVAYISTADIPKGGENIGAVAFSGSENLFATDVVEYVGHPLGVVVADSARHANEGAAKVRVEYDLESLGTPVLTIEDAVARNSFFSLMPMMETAKTGDIDKGFQEADHKILNAEVRTGSQYYFYMETQTALAIPDEDDCMLVYSSCQGPDLLQKRIATCLGIPYHNVRVITRRAGGGFGGKGFRSITIASACAVAANKLRHPVRMYLDRKTDMTITGGRHPSKTLYSVGFTSDGKITGLKVKVFLDAGWSEDLSPFIPMFVVGGMKKYNWGSLDAEFKVCKTNHSSKSAMRGPGHIQGSFIADTVLEHVAATLKLDVHTVIAKNLHTLDSASIFYSEAYIGGSEEYYTLPNMWGKLVESMEARLGEVETFNSRNVWLKRGLSMLPCIYDVHQFSRPARVSIFADGSVVVEVGGIELGQGLWTKVKQATVWGLSQLLPTETGPCGLESLKVRVVQADSISVPHGGITAASTTSEGSCEAVREACQILVSRLMPAKLKKEEESSSIISWTDLIQLAMLAEIDLSAQTHWFPDKSTNSYLNYGVAASEVEVNVLTGEISIIKTDILYDCGKSMNPAVDIGQIEGSFVQGIGFFMTEELEVDSSGKLVSNGTWTYKPPTLDNIPRQFSVQIVNGAAHQNRILSSKACGEPPLLLAGSVHSAIKRAIQAAQKSMFLKTADNEENHLRLDTPATMEQVKYLCGLDIVEQYLQHLASSKS